MIHQQIVLCQKKGGEEEKEREGEQKREKRAERGRLVMGEKKGMALCHPLSNSERHRGEEREVREERAVGSSALAGVLATGHGERKEGGRDIGRNNGCLVPIHRVERDRERERKREDKVLGQLLVVGLVQQLGFATEW